LARKYFVLSLLVVARLQIIHFWNLISRINSKKKL